MKKEKAARCSGCGHDKFKPDEYAKLKGVTRISPGDACCAKCGKDAPLFMADKIRTN